MDPMGFEWKGKNNLQEICSKQSLDQLADLAKMATSRYEKLHATFQIFYRTLENNEYDLHQPPTL